MIILLTLLQLVWFSLTAALLLFWFIYFSYLKLGGGVKQLTKRRQKKLRNIARFWLRKSLWLMLSNALPVVVILLNQIN